MTDPTRADQDWSWSWEQHELDQLRHGARLSLAEKLAWLEEAYEVAMTLRGDNSALDPGSPASDLGRRSDRS